MEFKKANVWEVFTGAETFQSFQKNILKPIYLKPVVNEEIKKHAASIEKLLLYSYYEYEFIDIAILQAVFTLEKAMSLRLKELDLSFSANKTLKNLSEWFFKNNYFETWNLGVIDQLRHIRNGKVHEEIKSLGGSAFIPKLYTALDLINDLYEDVDLRNDRKSRIENLHTELSAFILEGGILERKEKKLIIYNSRPVFINNKRKPETMHLTVWPIFDPKPYQEGRLIVPQSFVFKIENFKFNDHTFEGYEFGTGEKLTISKIDPLNAKKYIQWNETIKSLPTYHLIRGLDTFDLNKHFHIALREFHQLP